MIAEFGQFALILALGLALLQGFMGLAGAQRNDTAWMQAVRTLSAGQFGLVLVSYVLLTTAFLLNDFSLLYVAQNSNTLLPWGYRVAAVWGAHEGSLLLWILVLAGWALAVAWRGVHFDARFLSRSLGVLGLLNVGFMLFTLLTSNPFERIELPPLDGRDLNPILQDPALAIHPPLLYFGYVGLAVPFAFAIAALLAGEKDVSWARHARPWTTIAWLFLTLGIALGSWWAYYELGWGGWWFWDPVENASFLPWLIGTALIHSLAVTEKRGAFVSWTVLLAITGFSLSVLGTFLVRSGVLVSVHAFASDPARGMFILAFLAVMLGSALTLYAVRAPRLASGGGFKPWSRESFLLINNVLLTVAAAAVLLGTLYPLFLDALNLGKISVGPPYFNAVFIPLMLPLLLFVAFGPITRWKRDDWHNALGTLKLPLILSVAAVVIGVAMTWGRGGVVVTIALWLSLWAIFTAFAEPLSRLRHSDGASGLRRVPASSWGMAIAHLGLGVTALGIVAVSAFGVARDAVLVPGETVEAGGYEWRMEGLRKVEGPNYVADEAEVRVSRDGETVTVLRSQKRAFVTQQGTTTTEAGIRPRLDYDLYVALGEPLGGDEWSARLQVKPLVRLIWLGSLLMALGGGIAAFDRRYKRSRNGRAADAVTGDAN